MTDSASVAKGPRGIVVLGTDTEVGKTYVSCQIIRSLIQAGVQTGAYKPVASGFGVGDPESDPQRLLSALGASTAKSADIEACDAEGQDAEARETGAAVRQDADVDVDLVCPQVFRAPVAPPIAAALEGREVSWDRIRSGLEAWTTRVDFLLVEAAGGVLSPIAEGRTSADLAAESAFPALLVVANRLGCVNHCLLSLEALAARKVDVSGILLNDMSGKQSDESVETNAQLIRAFSSVPIYTSSHRFAMAQCVPVPD